MTRLIFEPIIFSILLLNVSEYGLAQAGNDLPHATAINFPSGEKIVRNSPLYIMSNIDKASQFRRTGFRSMEPASMVENNTDQLVNVSTVGVPVNHRFNARGITGPAYDSYSDLQFTMHTEPAPNRFELFREINPQKFNMSFKPSIPTSSATREAAKIASQMLLNLFKEYQRWPNQ